MGNRSWLRDKVPTARDAVTRSLWRASVPYVHAGHHTTQSCLGYASIELTKLLTPRMNSMNWATKTWTANVKISGLLKRGSVERYATRLVCPVRSRGNLFVALLLDALSLNMAYGTDASLRRLHFSSIARRSHFFEVQISWSWYITSFTAKSSSRMTKSVVWSHSDTHDD